MLTEDEICEMLKHTIVTNCSIDLVSLKRNIVNFDCSQTTGQ